ncbi:MAG: reverse transcriptase domain-containing protein [Flavobacterium sp.]|nr:reverse transcriptase domain-containing protein [Flavobacterium sp.]
MAVNKLVEKKKDWFKLKRYPHIDFPLNAKDRHIWIEDYVKNPLKIASHAFLPLIHKKSKVRKFRREYCKKTGDLLLSYKEGKKIVRNAPDPKERELYYAGHLDALVYSYYAEILTEEYEKIVSQKKLTDVVTAYRKIPVKQGSKKNKCNIDFAVDVFKSIKEYPKDNFVTIAFDIKGFFDNLNHKLLREQWKVVLGLINQPLPDDHFNVFKNISRFSYIDLVDIFKEFQDKIFVKSTKHHKEVITRKRISKIKYLKKAGAVAFCKKEEYLAKRKMLLKKVRFIKDDNLITKTKDFGIPQGSPISAILANIYMLDFDSAINKYLENIGGIYRRYSDDMVAICPLDKKDEVIKAFNEEIINISLSIQSKKTQIFHFERQGRNLKCGQEFPNGINHNKNFIYLGLEFDGEDVKIKSASISGYYRKMKRTIKRGRYFSNKPLNKYAGELFKSRLLKRFSYKGASRRRKYIWNSSKEFFEMSQHIDWGNFLSYAAKAQKIRLPNKIKSQTKKHWNKLNKLLKT